jgi:xanthine dehydrogenase iron-sulfur cluster and FAD-binding subunit A
MTRGLAGCLKRAYHVVHAFLGRHAVDQLVDQLEEEQAEENVHVPATHDAVLRAQQVHDEVQLVAQRPQLRLREGARRPG